MLDHLTHCFATINLFILTSSNDMSSFFLPSLVGLIMVWVLIQEWREEIPSRIP